MYNMMRTKKIKRVLEDKFVEDWEKELNIKHHKVNPESNCTILPRISRQAKKSKK